MGPWSAVLAAQEPEPGRRAPSLGILPFAVQHHQWIADCIHDALRHLPVAVAFLAGGTLFANILDGKKNKAVMFAGAKNLARIDQHGAPPDGGEIMLDLEAFD